MKQAILTFAVVTILGSLIGNTIYAIGSVDSKAMAVTILCMQDLSQCKIRHVAGK